MPDNKPASLDACAQIIVRAEGLIEYLDVGEEPKPKAAPVTSAASAPPSFVGIPSAT